MEWRENELLEEITNVDGVPVCEQQMNDVSEERQAMVVVIGIILYVWNYKFDAGNMNR